MLGRVSIKHRDSCESCLTALISFPRFLCSLPIVFYFFPRTSNFIISHCLDRIDVCFLTCVRSFVLYHLLIQLPFALARFAADLYIIIPTSIGLRFGFQDVDKFY